VTSNLPLALQVIRSDDLLARSPRRRNAGADLKRKTSSQPLCQGDVVVIE
jgi:hypothetical protein